MFPVLDTNLWYRQHCSYIQQQKKRKNDVMTPISRLNISISIGKMFEILSLKSLIHLTTNHSIKIFFSKWNKNLEMYVSNEIRCDYIVKLAVFWSWLTLLPLPFRFLSVKHTLVPLYNCRNFTPLDHNQIRSDVCEVAGKSKDSEASIVILK